MLYDPEQYRHRKDDVASILLRNPDRDRLEMIGVISCTTGIPIIAVATFVGEISGWDQALLDKLTRLKLFYEH